jgi:hypothetical protein
MMRSNTLRMVSPHSDIDALGLGAEERNALRRSGIYTVGELWQAKSAGAFPSASDVGTAAWTEIEKSLAQICLTEPAVRSQEGGSTARGFDAQDPWAVPGTTDRPATMCQAGAASAERPAHTSKHNTLAIHPAPVANKHQNCGLRDSLPRVRPLLQPDSADPKRRLGPTISLTDDISSLSLTVRTLNVLRRSNIRSIGDLLVFARNDAHTGCPGLGAIWNVGPKSIEEIEDRLAQFIILNGSELAMPSNDDPDSEFGERRMEEPALRREIRRQFAVLSQRMASWQLFLIERQIALGLLHGDALVGDRPIREFVRSRESTNLGADHRTLSAILYFGMNICDELSLIMGQCTRREVQVVIWRNGYRSLTLAEVGEQLSLSKERVRQIDQKAILKIASFMRPCRDRESTQPPTDLGGETGIPFVRIQSALLIARDMGPDMSYCRWLEEITSSGLLGRARSDGPVGIDPTEMMFAFCRALSANGYSMMEVPENLRLARAKLAGPRQDDEGSTPAGD